MSRDYKYEVYVWGADSEDINIRDFIDDMTTKNFHEEVIKSRVTGESGLFFSGETTLCGGESPYTANRYLSRRLMLMSKKVVEVETKWFCLEVVKWDEELGCHREDLVRDGVLDE